MAVHAPNHDDHLVDWDFLLSLYLLTHTASTATIHSFVFFFSTTNLQRQTFYAQSAGNHSFIQARSFATRKGQRQKKGRKKSRRSFPSIRLSQPSFLLGLIVFFSVRLTARKTNKPTTLPFKTTVPETQSKARLP